MALLKELTRKNRLKNIIIREFMMRKFSSVIFVVCLLVLSSFNVLAAEEGVASNAMWAIYIGAGFGIGLAAFGTGLGQGKAIAGAVEGIARNPGAFPRIFTTMLIGLAMIESLAIYALVVSLILLFVI